MKKFETPEVEIIRMAMMDVIATSVEEEEDEGYEPSFGMGNCV